MRWSIALLLGSSLLAVGPFAAQAVSTKPAAAKPVAQPAPVTPPTSAKPGPQVSTPATTDDTVTLDRSGQAPTPDQPLPKPIRNKTEALTFDPPKD